MAGWVDVFRMAWGWLSGFPFVVPPGSSVIDLVGEYAYTLNVTGESQIAIDLVGEQE